MSLLDLALAHEPAILNHRCLASPGALGNSIPLHGPVSLVRHPGMISIQLEGYPADVIVWYLDPHSARWTRHPHVQRWYSSWSENARIFHEQRRQS